MLMSCIGPRAILYVVLIPSLVIPSEVYLEELVDALPFCFQRREQVRRTEDVVDVVMQHVEIVEDIGSFRKPLRKGGSDFMEHRHKLPLQRWGCQIPMIFCEDCGQCPALLGHTPPNLHFANLGLQPVIGPDLRVELRKATDKVP